MRFNLPSISFGILALFCLSLTPTPAYAGEPIPMGNITVSHPEPKAYAEAKIPSYDNLLIGDRIVVSPSIEAVYWGKVSGEPTFKAVISAPKYCQDLVTPISCKWLTDGKVFWTDDNLFYASVINGEVKVTHDGKSMTFNPEVYISGGNIPVSDASPTLLGFDPINHNYYQNTLEWDYGVCKRHLRIIEGMLLEYFIFDTNPHGDVTIQSNAVVDKGFTGAQPMSAWDANGEPVTITGGDTITLSEFDQVQYPVTIDPDTSYVTSASDGYLSNNDGTYNTAWVATTADGFAVSAQNWINGQRISGDYAIWRNGVFFDTSDLPDSCNVTAATLALYGELDYTTVDYNITIQSGMPTYPHDPMLVGDYNKAYYSGNGGIFHTGSFNTSGYNNITLTSDAFSWINRTGTTKFILRSDEDINGSAPPSYEYVTCYSYEKGAGYQPTLYVTYTSVEAPSINTTAATEVSRTTAQLNAFLVDDGGQECEVRFEYDTDSGNPYTYNTTWVDGYTTGEYPYASISGLTNATTYYFRAQAKNDINTTSGSELSFSTSSGIDEPSNFVAIPRSTSEISLTWTKGDGSSTTYVVMRTGTYPTAIDDGTVVYNSTKNSVLVDDLSAGITYYFAAWGVDAGVYSNDTATDMGTTLAGAGDTDFLEDTTALPWLWNTPTTENLENLPASELVGTAATALDMPETTLWIILIMGIAVAVGASLYVFTRSIWIAILGVLGGIIYGWQAGLFPLWILIVFSVIAGSLFYINVGKGGVENAE